MPEEATSTFFGQRTPWQLLQQSLGSLQQSQTKTRLWLDKEEYNFEELESIDSLTSDKYLPKVVPELATEVIKRTDQLKENSEQTARFLSQRDWLN